MPRPKTTVEEFDPARVRPLPGQPRKRFRGIAELAGSIKEVGQLAPGIVTLIEDDPAFDAELVDGERRLRACKEAGVPFRAEVRAAGDAEGIFAASFAANFGKQHHDAIEIAESLERLKKAGKTLEQLGRIAGKSVQWVCGHLNLLKLHPSVQAMLIPGDGRKGRKIGEGRTARSASGKLTYSLAQLLTRLDEASQIKMAAKITGGDGMSLAKARRMILRKDEAAKDGRGRPAGRSIMTLESILADFEDRVGVFTDMPGAELNAMIDRVENREKRTLMEALADTAGTLETLAKMIGERLPKVGAAGRARA